MKMLEWGEREGVFPPADTIAADLRLKLDSASSLTASRRGAAGAQ